MKRTSATSIGGISSSALMTSSTACQRVTGFHFLLLAVRTCGREPRARVNATAGDVLAFRSRGAA